MFDDEVSEEIRLFFIKQSMQGGLVRFYYGDLVRVF